MGKINNISFLLSMPILITIIAVSVLLVLILILLALKFKKKNKGHVKVDNEFMDELLLSLGGKDNIDKVDVLNGRLKIDLKDTSKAVFDKLKEMAQAGVFVTGNTIKVLFKYDSKIIKDNLDNIL
ncbi:MAG: PTS transporter subunit EIIB [Acholeplasmatales bacterium]|nr:PTS transporter subunit EIIB [Acholeplasmatales bacterium]